MFRSTVILLILLLMCKITFAQKYLFYLHGKIVEDQGVNAQNDAFGRYEYDGILARFRDEHFIVMSEIRKPNTDVKEYANKVVLQIDSLLKAGAKPDNITVVGASKGALIAMFASTYLNNQHVNFVFLSSCNDYVAASFSEINFTGNILSIYEKSDIGNQSCGKIKDHAKRLLIHYKEIELNTGLKHGYLYKPIPEWMEPTIRWANGKYD